MQFFTSVQVGNPSFSLHPDSHVMVLGSCFAEVIGSRLKSLKIPCCLNPFGTLYNPLSIAQALCQIMDGRRYHEADKEVFEARGQWHSWMHHGIFSHTVLKDCLEHINNRLTEAQRIMENLDLLVVTLGTSYVYRLRTDDDASSFVVSNCHRQPERLFERRMENAADMAACLLSVLERLLTLRPDVKVVLSVSPIRHLRDGLHQNQLSKSALMLAVDEVCRRMPDVCWYFPAYEMMMDEWRDYRFYADDMIHPTPLAQQMIGTRFVEACADSSCKAYIQEWTSLHDALAHRPLHPESDECRAFYIKLKDKLGTFAAKYPHVDLQEEYRICNTRLEK